MPRILPFILGVLVAGQALAMPEIIANASTAEKGFVAESFMEELCLKTDRVSIWSKWDPNIHGPDKIFRLPNGSIELHEVKGYTSWAGQAAMQTTVDGTPTYELSREWVDTWIRNTLTDPLSTQADRETATLVQRAVKEGRVSFIYDEVNYSTAEFRTSTVEQIGRNEVRLFERTGKTSIKRLERQFAERTERYHRLKVEKLMKSPTTRSLKEPLSREGVDRLKDSISRENGTEAKACAGLLTEDGRLLVAVREGVTSGLLVFAIDTTVAFYRYESGETTWAAFEREVEDAAFKGVAVGGCVAVSVILGATPAGWVVFAVGVGSYIIADLAAAAWHNYQDRGYLTMNDLRAWGLDTVSVLSPLSESVLTPKKEPTVLDPIGGGVLSPLSR